MIGRKLSLCILGLAATLFVSAEGIVNGDIAEDNQFPYQVLLQTYHPYRPGQYHYFCGGGIVSDRFILTAAHCLIKIGDKFKSQRIFVLAGTNDFSKTSGTVRVEVAKVYVPADYNREPPGNVHDIALLRLKEPLGLEHHRNLKALELPRDARITYADEDVTIAGFGWDWAELLPGPKNNGGHTDTKLRFAKAVVLSNSECQRRNKKIIPDKKICAWTLQRPDSGASGVCYGDSGGPIVHGGKTVLGVLSGCPWGCNETEESAVYTRVSSYMDFIDNVVTNKKTRDVRFFELIPPRELYV